MLAILDLTVATPREVVAWTSSVLRRARKGQAVALLVARDHSHVIAVDAELAERLEEGERDRR